MWPVSKPAQLPPLYPYNCSIPLSPTTFTLYTTLPHHQPLRSTFLWTKTIWELVVAFKNTKKPVRERTGFNQADGLVDLHLEGNFHDQNAVMLVNRGISNDGPHVRFDTDRYALRNVSPPFSCAHVPITAYERVLRGTVEFHHLVETAGCVVHCRLGIHFQESIPVPI